MKRPRPRPDRTLSLPSPRLPRMPPTLGPPTRTAAPSPPSTASSACAVRSAAAATPTAPATAGPPARAGGPLRPAAARVRPRRHRPGRPAPPRRAPQRPGDPRRAGPPRRGRSAQRSVGNLLDRYDELLALSLADADRLRRITGRGRAGDPGHRRPAARRRPRGPLGAPRRASRGEVLLARSLLSSTGDDLAELLARGRSEALAVPIAGVVSDGQDSIRKAVRQALPGVPISSASSTTCARRPSRSTRPTATPRCS